MNQPAYPKRPSHFAHKFCRLMGKVCLANELGAEACWLLSVIAMTEDAKGYRNAVSYFNEQLFPIAGLGSVSSLIRLRTKCEAAGWLVHIPGSNRTAARYWVAIPDRYTGMDDAPTDENPNDYHNGFGSQFDERTGDEAEPKRNRSGNEAVTKRQPSGDEANNLPPTPTPEEDPPTPLPGGENFDAPLYEAIAEACEKDPIANRSVLIGPYEALSAAEPPFTPEEVRAFKLDFWKYVPRAKKDDRSVPFPNEVKNNIPMVRVNARKAAKRLQSKPKIVATSPSLADECAAMSDAELTTAKAASVGDRLRTAAIDRELKRRGTV